ncbi:uncharacterized protein PGTG_06390 [Puccinia graminis f. sp. tritici CRL 75-36-700-3]|uniref:Uncharacterized protein n=1 Tax=Puccinia graminis f. sp. tritici (strain CRL 75-36-700-3 / race SCCL) TaxID=418459 RepID=E3K860_PUCGT|nr:uncharacterized protein PGTG_06390 [Puccinia graminis f. sp. tritici CRL 75-36-700-3]EFP80434.2 hypothetical protein PGTG_06390 [Puccinia graminis f. sp. tritici CRL 75-36-700-3]
MALIQFLVIALLGLQVLAASPPKKPVKPMDPTVPQCYTEHELMGEVQKADCPAALAKIIYEKDTLSKLETRLAVVSGDCVIRLNNTKQVVVTKKQIEDTVTELTKSSCKSGHAKVKGNAEVSISITARGKPRAWFTPYDPDFPLGKPFCFRAAQGQVVKEDCLEAFNQLPVDEQGQLVSPADKKIGHTFNLKVKSCRVIVYTTDGSNVSVKKQDISAVVTGMINNCNSQWGTVNVKGTEGPNGQGPNGHVTIVTRSY